MKANVDFIKTFSFRNLSGFSEIRHFISTRVGGCSPPPFDSLNIGFHTADSHANVLENRKRLFNHLGIPLDYLVTAKQVHGDRVAIITQGIHQCGAYDYHSAIEATDSLVTNIPGRCLMVQVADCTPILLYDPLNHVIAAIHAGWRSSVQLIAKKTVCAMIDTYKCRPENIVAGIGPSIGPCCYEVGPEVIAGVQQAMGTLEGLLENGVRSDQPHLNLWEVNRRQLLEVGVREENVEIMRLCTRCHSDLFFSERACRGTGRFGVGIMLTGER
jgi:YfiH family protein